MSIAVLTRAGGTALGDEGTGAYGLSIARARSSITSRTSRDRGSGNRRRFECGRGARPRPPATRRHHPQLGPRVLSWSVIRGLMTAERSYMISQLQASGLEVRRREVFPCATLRLLTVDACRVERAGGTFACSPGAGKWTGCAPRPNQPTGQQAARIGKHMNRGVRWG